MKQEQQPAVLSPAAEEAPAVHRSRSSSSSKRLLDQEEINVMASSSPSHRSSSFIFPSKAAIPFPCSEVTTAAATTTMSSAGSVATTTTPSRGSRGSNSNILISPSSSSSCFSSSVRFSSCSPPSSLSSSPNTGLLRSLCRQCSSDSRTPCCQTMLPPAPPSAAAAETSKTSGCYVFQQQQHSCKQPPRLSCTSIMTRCAGREGVPSREESSLRRYRFPTLLHLPAATMLTTTMLLILLTGGGGGLQPAAAQLKFAAIGNWGFESGSQQQVADTLKQVARSEHLSFLLSPGSNFAGGVSGPADPKWKRLFEDMYSDPAGALKMPFFTVLGAEDWSGDYTAEALRTEVAYSPTGKYATGTTNPPEEEKQEPLQKREEEDAEVAVAAREMQISETYPKWTLPNWWYHYLMHFPASTGSAFINSGHKDMSVGLIFLDTWVLSSSFPFSDITRKAWQDAENTLTLAPKLLDYIIVVTDRPVYSSGSSKGDSSLQYYLKPLLEKADIDVLISGYDFSQEVIVHNGISYVNCGAGSFGVGSSMVKDRGSQFYSGQAGFCVFELTADGLVTRLVDGTNGETLYEYKQALKKRPDRKTIDAFKFVSQLPEVKYWAVPSMGKMPGRDVFVRVVGTIGLCIATFFASLSVASLVSRYTK